MKKIISLFIVLIALVGCMSALASCNDTDVCQHRDADDDGLCDKCGDGYTDGKDLPDEPACQHRDADDNGKCDECGEDFEDVEVLQGTDISSASLKVIGDKITGIVSNSQETFSFLNDITVANGASYVVARDVFCENVIHTKNAPLTTGDNTLYILVTSGNDMKLYTVTIRRRPMYTVSFDTGKEGSIASQTVEEGNVATEPTETPTLSGCTFSEWDYDFSTPVTDNIKISAKYNVIPEMAIFDFTSTETTCTITGIKSANVTELTIPEIVTSISSSAFEGCSLLANITVNENNGNYKSIDGNLYTKDGKVLVKYASGKTDASFTIPNSVTSIGYAAFEDCSSLTSVTIPDSVTSIGAGAFSGCHITYASIPASVISYIPKGYLKEVVITSGTKIGNGAFSDCSSLTSVTIPDSVTSIGDDAFRGCSSLSSVTIPDSVTSIGDDAFRGCSSLSSVTIPDSVTKIGNSAFYNCSSLTGVTIGNSVTKIGDSAFYYCYSLTSVTIPNSVTKIGDCAFYNCSSLTSVTIGNSVTSIGEDAFRGCYKLVEVINKSELNVKASSYDYGYVAYYAKKVHNGTSKIVNKNDYLFYTYNGVNYLIGYTGNETDLILPESYNREKYEIYKYAFYGCSSLTSVTIPDSVTSIGGSAFYNCYKLVEVINKSSLYITVGSYDYGYVAYYAKEVHNGTSKIVNKNDYLFYTYNGVNYLIGYTGNETDLILPESYNGENYEIYKYAFYKCSSLTSVTIGNSVTSIGSSAFEYCSSLTSVTIPNSVTYIGEGAFAVCSSLTSITIPDSVTYIGKYAFWGCSSLTSITIPDSVTSIGNYAFASCSSLTSVTIPDSVTYIGGFAFSGCSSLTNITIPDSVTSIGNDAFSGCSSLTSVTIGNSVTSIGNDAFEYCSSLTSVTIPNSVTSIGYDAFASCSSLTSVTIPDSVTSIGDYAFAYCYWLTGVTIGNSVTKIGNYAFYNCSSLTIYCEAESQPSGWNYSWNYSNRPVVWGYTDEE